MLGNQVHKFFRQNGLDSLGTVRESEKTEDPKALVDFSVEAHSDDFFSSLPQTIWVINCIGMIKSRIISAKDKPQAIRVNSLFPHQLNEAAETFDFKVIQIATDCVYSGATGQYSEDSMHDPTDIYGMTKSLGEVQSERFMNLRCSIIGPELAGRSSLLEWVRSQPTGAEIDGYVNHLWNGITTLAFARIVAGIIANDGFQHGTFHVVPRDVVTKDQLVRLIADRFGRTDLSIRSATAPHLVERSLKTNFPEINARLWKDAGYAEIPSIPELVEECPVG